MGSFVAGFGFFFLPLLEIKPNRLASGVTVNLFEIPGDLRYMALFIMALIPLFLAFQQERQRRGWSLVVIGNLILFLTLVLPTNAAIQLLDGAELLFEEGTRISNPRVFTSSAMAIGLLGGYIILFAGLRDLFAERTGAIQRFLASTAGLLIIFIFLVNGNLDIYSVMVEFNQRGETLGRRFIEHVVFVIVSLMAGLVIGLSLGLWAARDKRIEDVILYAVGIIQTIPSLALFGVLLVPLARLGDQSFLDVAQFLVVSLALGIAVLVASFVLQKYLSERWRSWTIIVPILALVIPLTLFAVLVITFGFRVVLNIFTNPAYGQILSLVLFALVGIFVLLWLDRRMDDKRKVDWLKLARWALLMTIVFGGAFLLVNGASQVIGNRSIDTLTIRNLGVSGIGVAPAIIALTLYSLLPLVRNTYAGLRNVDNAIIDSGRGMGMTPAQIFFQIELPLALPIIMAGMRNAGISLVGIAAVASIIGAGALGDFILLGVNTTSVDLILLGAIPAVILAVLLDATMQILEGLLTSPGIRHGDS